MRNDDSTAGTSAGDDDQPDGAPRRTFRQLLHWATGDRAAEAVALADASPNEVTLEDATKAVARAHNDEPSGRDADASDIASVDEAIAVHEQG